MNEVLPGIILACTLRGTILIAVAALAAPWARRAFGRDGAHWLWVAALLALLWPSPPRSPLSLQNLWAAKGIASSADHPGDSASGAAHSTMPFIVKLGGPKAEGAGNENHLSLPHNAADSRANPYPPHTGRFAFWFIGIWSVGATVMLAQLCWRWLRTMRTLRAARPVSDDCASQLLQRFNTGKRVTLATTSCIRAPALAGIWRPRILIPEGWLEELLASDLEAVVLHELGHHVRRDLVWEWLFAIVRCVHWMNPAVWWAERQARHERELACDAWALERSAFPLRYGDALLEALKRVHQYPPASFGVVAMAEDIRQITRRIEHISRHRPSPRWLTAIAWMPALLVLAAVGSDPLEAVAQTPSPSAPPLVSGRGSIGATQPADVAPIPPARRSVEVTASLLRVPESMVKQLGWPVAEEGSNGVQRIFSQEEFRKIIPALKATPGVEVLPVPSLLSRSGFQGTFEAIREFRYGYDYKPSSESSVVVPGSIESTNLGMIVQWKAQIQNEKSIHLDLKPTLRRLIGFEDSVGKLTKTSAPPADANWQSRLVHCDMPMGAHGYPVFSSQDGRAQLDLDREQIAIAFGFRDVDRTSGPGGSPGVTSVLYFVVQVEIAP